VDDLDLAGGDPTRGLEPAIDICRASGVDAIPDRASAGNTGRAVRSSSSRPSASAIRSTIDRFGSIPPRSTFAMYERETPTRAATCCWVRSRPMRVSTHARAKAIRSPVIWVMEHLGAHRPVMSYGLRSRGHSWTPAPVTDVPRGNRIATAPDGCLSQSAPFDVGYEDPRTVIASPFLLGTRCERRAKHLTRSS
jgi:hypothetical protein